MNPVLNIDRSHDYPIIDTEFFTFFRGPKKYCNFENGFYFEEAHDCICFVTLTMTKIHHKNCIMVRGGVGAISTYLGGVNLFGLTIMI